MTSSRARTNATFRSESASDHLIAATKEALERNSHYHLVEHSGGEWTLTTGVTFRTWGMRINVSVVPDTSGSRMSVYIQPKLPTTIVDWGKGKSIAKDLGRAIDERLSSMK